MSGFDNLLRLHRWQLEERQRLLAELESLAERLRGDARRLQFQAESQSRALGVALDENTVVPLFIRPLIERGQKLERSAAELEPQILAAREAVDVARQEVKRYELAGARPADPVGDRLTRRSRREQLATLLFRARKQVS